MDSHQNSSIICQDTLTKMREELKEHFTCFICLDLATDPVVIPCCGQIVCSNCLKNWFSSKSSSTCPYCRQKLTSKEGIPIKWSENIKKFLQISIQKCKKHQKILEFYCETCDCFLCPECLFEELTQANPKHRSHSIIKFSEMLKVIKTRIQNELIKILPKMGVIENNLNQVRSLNQDLILARDSVLSEMNKKFNEIKNTTETQFKECEVKVDNALQKLLKARQSIREEIESIQKHIELKKTFNSKFYNQHIEEFKKIKSNIPKHELFTNSLECNELILQFSNFTVNIPNFKQKNEQYKNLPADSIHFYYPGKINLDGNTWRVKIYPNGNLNGEGTHLSVFLELLRGPKEPTTYSYRIVIENLSNPEAKIQREYSSQFAEADSWGWNKAALLETLFNGNYLDKDGGLSINFSIKPESYYQINQDYDHAIKRKRDKCLKLKKYLNELENNQFNNDDLDDSEDLFKNDSVIKPK